MADELKSMNLLGWTQAPDSSPPGELPALLKRVSDPELQHFLNEILEPLPQDVQDTFRQKVQAVFAQF